MQSNATRPANRLSRESSPYLLAHAHNPVDWHPWGEEALARARRERKLIFLSIGYSSCYWCHVMERESFLDDAIAAQLNAGYVAIKVDREERPDIDDVYMHALQVYLQLSGAGGSGGWPMTMILTPDAKPLFGATYLPPADRDERWGLSTVLKKISAAWSQDPDKWQESGDQLANIVRQSLDRRERTLGAQLSPQLADGVFAGLASMYDEQYGGFGFDDARPTRPKFPEPTHLVFLLDRAERRQDAAAREMAVRTLVHMACGGIRDHVGGGFHRYSTDRYWRVPHFEKMLYDQGQLLSVYSRAYRLTGQALFRDVATEIAAFVERELTDPAGGFYTALDAETRDGEGRFYVWSREELRSLLAPDEFEIAAATYGCSGEANFEGRFILLRDSAAAAQAQGQAPAAEPALARIREKLLSARNQRERPATDRKVLTSWNGLMIRGLVEASVALDEPRYREAAARAARFVLANLRDSQGDLLHSYAAGAAKIPGFLDDYAYFIDGLLSLHDATHDPVWLDAARALADRQHALFQDDSGPGYFSTSTAHEALFARGKAFADGVMPAANTVAGGNFVRLSRTLGDDRYRALAHRQLQQVAAHFDQGPAFAPQGAAVIEDFLAPDDADKNALRVPPADQ